MTTVSGLVKSLVTNQPITRYISINHNSKLSLTTQIFQVWFCLASEQCKKKALRGHNIAIKGISLFPSVPIIVLYAFDAHPIIGAVTNCTNHLRDVHGLISDRSTKLLKRKISLGSDYHEMKRARHISQDVRYWSIRISMVSIELCWPINWFENPSLRTLLQTNPGNFPIVDAHDAKTYIMEIYGAATSKIAKEVAAVKQIGSPMFHVNIGLWKENCSGDCYVGVRLCCVNEAFELKSVILSAIALTAFTDSAAAGGGHIDKDTAAAVLEWVHTVLHEFGLDSTEDVRSYTADNSEVLAALQNSVAPAVAHWSIPHMIGCAFHSAFGVDSNPTQTFPIGQLLNTLVSIASLKASHVPGPLGLTRRELASCAICLQGVTETDPFAWNIVLKLIKHAVAHWKTVVTEASQAGIFLPADSRHCLLQVAALQEPLLQLMNTARETNTPTGVDVLLALYNIKKTILNVTSPVIVVDPSLSTVAAAGGSPTSLEVGSPGGESASGSNPGYSHDQLSIGARIARERLIAYLNAHFFDGYTSAHRSYSLDLCAAMYPPTVGLKHVAPLLDAVGPGAGAGAGDVESSPSASAVSTIWNIVENLAISFAAASKSGQVTGKDAGSADATRSSLGGGGGGRSLGELKERTLRTSIGELFDYSDEEDNGTETSVVSSMRKTVKEELVRYRALRVKISECVPGDLLQWWKTNSDRFPSLARAARALLVYSCSAEAFGGAGTACAGKGATKGSFGAGILQCGYPIRAVDDDPNICSVLLMLRANLLAGSLPTAEDVALICAMSRYDHPGGEDDAAGATAATDGAEGAAAAAADVTYEEAGGDEVAKCSSLHLLTELDGAACSSSSVAVTDGLAAVAMAADESDSDAE